MEALTKQIQELMGALQDVKVQQSIYECKFQQQDYDFTFSEDETSHSQQLTHLTAIKTSITKIESKTSITEIESKILKL